MKSSEIDEVIEAIQKEIQGKYYGEIDHIYNEIAATTNGSIIDGIKLGYLYHVLNEVE